MRKKSEIKRAIEALRQKCDHISQAPSRYPEANMKSC